MKITQLIFWLCYLHFVSFEKSSGKEKMKITINTKDLDLFTAKMLSIILGTITKINSEEEVENTLITFEVVRLSAFEAKHIALIIWNSATTSAKMKYELLKQIDILSTREDFDLFLGNIQRIEDDMMEMIQ